MKLSPDEGNVARNPRMQRDQIIYCMSINEVMCDEVGKWHNFMETDPCLLINTYFPAVCDI